MDLGVRDYVLRANDNYNDKNIILFIIFLFERLILNHRDSRICGFVIVIEVIDLRVNRINIEKNIENRVSIFFLQSSISLFNLYISLFRCNNSLQK